MLNVLFSRNFLDIEKEIYNQATGFLEVQKWATSLKSAKYCHEIKFTLPGTVVDIANGNTVNDVITRTSPTGLLATHVYVPSTSNKQSDLVFAAHTLPPF